MVVLCKYCNKEFSSYQSRCNHIRKFHNDKKSLNDNDTSLSVIKCQLDKSTIKYKCKKCNGDFSTRQSKWFHEKKCSKDNSELIELKKENEMIKKQLKIHPKKLQKINKQLHNEGTIGAIGNNNVIHNTFVKFGDVKFENVLDEKQILSILNKHFLSLEESIKMVHFNDKLPEYSNIYITNMRDNVAYIFNGKQFIKINKNEAISKLISNHTDEISYVYDDNKDKLKSKIAKRVDAFLDLLNNDDEYVDVYNKKYDSYKAYKMEDIKRLIHDNSDAKKLAELKKIQLVNISENEKEIDVTRL